METQVLDKVLTIEETKLRMKDIRDAAVHHGGIVHFGDRGRDELVIVSSRLWEEVNMRKQADIAGEDASAPYAVFTRALQNGRLGSAAETPLHRRRIPGMPSASGLSADEMAQLAGSEPPPRRRRRAR